VRCDRLVLLRQGRVLSDSTLPDLLSRTGTTDAEQAFLALIDAADRAGGADGVGRGGGPPSSEAVPGTGRHAAGATGGEGA
jgi:ABC-2 type transport system ATP-binding protein